MRRWTVLLLAILAACGVSQAAGDGDDPPPNPKWFVCKYETDPKGEERLQTGQNPISVSENAFPAGVTPAIGVEFNDAQGRSLIIAEDVGQPEPPTRDDCPPPNPPPTTTTAAPTTTTSTTGPVITPFLVNVGSVCVDGEAFITITMGNRPDLEGQVGTLTITPPGTALPLTFLSNQTQQVPYPAGADGADVNMTYLLAGETESGQATFPGTDCGVTTTTGATTSTTSTTAPPSTTTTTSSLPTTTTTTTTTPPPFAFGAAATVCVAEVPTIRIVFQNTFPALAGQTGTLTMEDINGNVVSTQPLVYEPGTTVDLLYPGTSVNPDGSIDDVPGWILTDDGFWIRDPSDAFLRDGITLTYTVNPTATAFVTYPPESSTCANPDGPFPPPGVTPPPVTTTPGLPPTR